jgi:Zn-dependent metalloprotease
MFRQWQAGQTAGLADWLIGKDIVGPAAIAKGLTCLRDMAKPDATHCLAPQPTKYSQITPGMDPHYSSGPPNLAFCTACKSAGGNSWDGVGKVWYAVLTGSGSRPTMTMKDFANRTRATASQLFPGNNALQRAVDQGWKQVGL